MTLMGATRFVPGILLLAISWFALCGSSQSTAKWTKLRETSPPDMRSGGGAAYCEQRDTMILFGGYSVAPERGRVEYANDLWEFSFANQSWVPLPLPVRPSPRIWFTIAAIPQTNPGDCQVVIHGGFGKNSSSNESAVENGEVWLLSMINGTTEWEQLALSTPGPGNRSMGSAVYRRGQFIHFGGSFLPSPNAITGVAHNDLWSLTIGTKNESGIRAPSVWTLIPRANSTSFVPEVRFSHTMSLRLGATPEEDELYVHGGRRYGPSDFLMLADLVIYSFGTNTWRTASGLRLERALHSSIIVNGRFVAFGGSTRVPTSSTNFQTYVFNSVLVTNLDPALNKNIGDTNIGMPQCTATDGKSGLWCVVDIDRGEPEPLVRHEFPYIQRKDELVVYGGRFQTLLGDMWSLNVTRAVQDMDIAEADSLGSNDLASTMYFMIAILSMMVVCFVVFVISLRRQRSNGPIFQGMMQNNRPRVVGARQSVIDALPLKTFKKKEAEERRASRRLSRLDAQQGPSSSSAAANRNNPAAEEGTVINLASPSAAATVTGDNNNNNDRIEEDDLHDLCAICLTEYEDGEQLRVLPCDHFFHPDCVDQWLRTHNACPMCKAAVDPDPDRNEEANANQQMVVAPAEEAMNPTFMEQQRAQSSAAAAAAVDPEAGPASSSRSAVSNASAPAAVVVVAIDVADSRSARSNASAASNVVPVNGGDDVEASPRQAAPSNEVVIDLAGDDDDANHNSQRPSANV